MITCMEHRHNTAILVLDAYLDLVFRNCRGGVDFTVVNFTRSIPVEFWAFVNSCDDIEMTTFGMISCIK